ncbi:MAG: hypothetical protein AAF628_13950 [Planctomycetota bacterium]
MKELDPRIPTPPWASPPPAPALDALWLAVAALAAYVSLGQSTLFNRDAHVLLDRLGEGDLLHGHHLLYFPFLHGVHAVAGELGWSRFESARLASAIGMAIGVAFIHLACRHLRLPRLDAMLATALVAACPAMLFFATVVEVHGPFYMTAGLASLAAAGFCVTPRIGTALGLGLALGLASSAHASAHLMAGGLIGVLWCRTRRCHPSLGVASHAMLLGLAVAVQGAAIFGVPAAVGALGFPREYDAAVHLKNNILMLAARPDWPQEAPALAWAELRKEWLQPMAPLCVAFLAGVGKPRLVAETIGLLLGALPYLALVVVLLAHFPDASERGAYLLPLVWPAALITAAAWHRVLVAAMVVLAAGIGFLQIRAHDQPQASHEYATGLRTAAGPKPAYLVVGDYQDLEALHVQLPEVEYLFVTDLIGRVPVPESQLPLFLQGIDQILGQALDDGMAVFLTEGAERFLGAAETAAWVSAPALLKHLRSHYALASVQEGGFRGSRLSRR